MFASILPVYEAAALPLAPGRRPIAGRASSGTLRRGATDVTPAFGQSSCLIEMQRAGSRISATMQAIDAKPPPPSIRLVALLILGGVGLGLVVVVGVITTWGWTLFIPGLVALLSSLVGVWIVQKARVKSLHWAVSGSSEMQLSGAVLQLAFGLFVPRGAARLSLGGTYVCRSNGAPLRGAGSPRAPEDVSFSVWTETSRTMRE